LDRHVDHESALERDYFVLQEFSPEVSRFEEQPVRIPITGTGGVTGSYVPDGLTWYHDPQRPPTLAEVKYQWQLEQDKDELAPKLQAGHEYALLNGLEFVVATDREIKTPLLKNAKFLLPYRENPPEPKVAAVCLQLVVQHGPLTAGRLQSLLADSVGMHPGEVLPCIWFHVATFAMRTDLQTPLNMNSLLTTP
jgi:hypothetical protein